MRAIVIDDSKATRILLRNILTEAKIFDIAEAGDGKEALDYLSTNGPVDLALVDWNMPNMTGYELIRKIRADSKFDEMRIVMVTTEKNIVSVTKALDAGADEFVRKPFTSSMILEKLELLGISQ